MAEKEKMIIDLCFSSDDEKEKEKDTGPIDLCSPDASEDEAPEAEPARAAEPAGAEEPAGAAEPARAAEPLAGAAEPARRDSESVKREAPPSAGHIVCFLKSNPGHAYERIPLDATVTFGRALSSDVRIPIAHCSRHHAELRVDQNSRVSLVNLAKAANSTRLNAQPLAPQATRDVRDGDVFEICGRRFKFEASVAAPSAKRARVDDDGGDDDVMEVAPPPARPPPPPPPGAAGDDDDEVQITQHAGALTDFPHSREHCTTFPIAADASKRCANCYCYVCDAPAAKCAQWTTHCAARHGDPRWRAERAAHARGDTQQGAQQLAARGTTTAAVTVTPVARGGGGVESILEAVTRVYPEEAQAPAGFTTGITLRPYQRQSLAFMLNVERRTGNELPPLGAKGTRGGWLCDEVGMGKTAVVVATCLAHPETVKRGSDAQWSQMVRAIMWTPAPKYRAEETGWTRCPDWQGQRLQLKATLVLTNVSLVGQWEDEFKKFAPGLRVQRFYGSDKFTRRGLGDWRDVDVLISTFTTPFLTRGRFERTLLDGAQFHRLVIDECHLASKAGRGVDELRATHKWAVTGTPMSQSVYSIMTQADLIDQRTQELLDLCGGVNQSHRGARDKLVAALRRLMIRHTKAQRIGGAVALALPDEVVSTVLLDQTAAEKQLYRFAFAQSASRRRSPPTQCFGLSMALVRHRQACQQSRVKREALFADLRSRGASGGCRAVIFTEFKDVHTEIVVQLRSRYPSWTIFEFSGSTGASTRHTAIRKFQASDHGNKVFVITMRAGNVGITLTAADVVYLLGPCVDPGDEVQAAGRIHRLGQTRRVLLKKFIMRGTVEEAIEEFHSKLKTGVIKFTSGSMPASAAQLLCSK